MFTILKVLASSAFASGAVQSKIRAAKQTAGAVALLAVCAFIAAIVGAVCVAAAVYLALLPVMEDYQAALAVGGGFIGMAGIVSLLAIARLRRGLPGGGRASAEDGSNLPPAADLLGAARGGQDPIVRLIAESVQSPVVMSALALGIFAGRMTKRAKRD